MARSTYIYEVRHDAIVTRYFTVKHEAVSYIEKYGPLGFELWRHTDGGTINRGAAPVELSIVGILLKELA